MVFIYFLNNFKYEYYFLVVMSNGINDLGARINSILQQFEGSSHLTLEQRKELESARSILQSGQLRAEGFLRDNARAIPEEIVSYTEFLELTCEDSPLARLERQLQEEHTEQAAFEASTLQSVIGVERQPSSANLANEREKYAKVARALIEYPHKHPRSIVLTVDEVLVSGLRDYDSSRILKNFEPPKRMYSIKVDDLDNSLNKNWIKTWISGDLLSRYLKVCLSPKPSLQALIESHNLVKGLSEGLIVGELILMNRYQRQYNGAQWGWDEDDLRFGHKRFKTEIANALGLVKECGYGKFVDIPSSHSVDPVWVTEVTLRKGLEYIKNLLLQNGFQPFEVRAGRICSLNILYTLSS